MVKFTRVTLVALVFLAGCAVGGASSRLVEPAQAYKGTRWLYRCVDVGGQQAPEVERRLNRFGTEGYELVVATNVFACFKWPI